MNRDRHKWYNAACMATGESLWGFGGSLVAPMTILVALLHSQGASGLMVGSIMSVQNGLLVLPQWLGILLFRSRRRRKFNLMLVHMLVVPPTLIAMAFITHQSAQWGPRWTCWLLWSCFALLNFGLGLVVGVWSEWIAHIFETRIRGRVIGFALGLSSLVGAGGVFISAAILKKMPGTDGYSLLYLLAAGVVVVALAVYMMVRDPAEADEVEPHVAGLGVLLQKFKHSLSDRNFRNFLIGRLLATFGFTVPPFMVIHYQSSDGGLLIVGWIIAYSAAEWIARGVANLFTGWLGDKRGHRMCVVLGAVTQVATLVVLATTGGVWSCIAAFAGIGICMAAADLSYYNLLIETCPHDNRGAHITVGNLATLPAIIAAPLLAGLLVQRSGTTALVYVSLAISVVALAWYLAKVKEPRTLSIMTS